MAKRCGTRICRKGHRPLWRILPSGTPTEPVLLRLPTEAEWEAERLSWGSQDPTGAFNSPVKLTIAGYRTQSTGVIANDGEYGYYWSSNVSGVSARLLLFNTTDVLISNGWRASANSVRLIVNGTFTQQQFDDNYLGQTIVIEGLTYGYAYNTTTQRIWLDRNLGATQVSTSSTDAASYGWLYQWGRLTDGHQIRTSATTATLSAGDVPANGNFITTFFAPRDWRNPQNDNLWQGVDGINNPAN